MPEKEAVIRLEPADVFLTRGHGFISCAIRFFTRGIGEKRTKVNHVGIVVEAGTPETAVVIEALSRVNRHRLWNRYGPPSKDFVAIHRATNLSPEEKAVIVAAAEKYRGQEYGKLMIVAHLLDWMLLGAYFFRRLVPGDKYPICSWVVAESFGKAGKHFGVEAGEASPDDIHDFITEKRPDLYETIHPLLPLGPR